MASLQLKTGLTSSLTTTRPVAPKGISGSPLRPFPSSKRSSTIKAVQADKMQSKAHEDPGGTTKTISKCGRLQTNGTKLRILVPNFLRFPNLLQLTVDPRTNLATPSGFCGDVFNAAFNALRYGVDVEFTPLAYEDGMSYTDVIDKVHRKEFDAAIGDITITANRSLYVDFTLPFSDQGVGMLARNAKQSMWIFLNPLSGGLWITTFGFFLVLGFVIWFIEHRTNEEFQGSSRQQIGTTLCVGKPKGCKKIEAASENEDGNACFSNPLPSVWYAHDYETDFEAEKKKQGKALKVFQKGSMLAREMSSEIAKLREDGTLKALDDKWFKRQSSLMSNDFSSPPPHILNLYGLRGLFLISGVSMAVAFLVSMVYLVHEKCHGRDKMQILRHALRRSAQIHVQDSDIETTV